MAGLEGSHENRCEIPKACLRKNTANFRTDYPKDKEALQLMVRGWDNVAADCEDRLISKAARELLDRICLETVR